MAARAERPGPARARSRDAVSASITSACSKWRRRLGRDFVPEDDRPNAAPVVMLSDRLWRRRFAADPEIIGRQITLDGSGYEVIGVMPAAFEHRLMPVSDVWRSLQYDRTLPSLQGREWGHHLRMVARLREGVSRSDAVAELAQIARDPIERFARAPWAAMPQGLLVDSLHGDLTRESQAGDGCGARRRRIPAADRVRQRGQPAARPRRATPRRVRNADGIGRGRGRA